MLSAEEIVPFKGKVRSIRTPIMIKDNISLLEKKLNI